MSTVFHLGSHAVLTTCVRELLQPLIAHTKRLELPIRDASALGAWYFSQFEELIKDTFRVLFMIPSFRDAFLSGSHIPLFHSDYILPVGPLRTEENDKAIAVVRKVYEAYVDTYLGALGEIDPEGHRGLVWRCGSCAVVNLDITSERRKFRKKDLAEGQADAEGGATGTQQSDSTAGVTPKGINKGKSGSEEKYSIGFLHRNQIKLIKSVMQDLSVSHLVLHSQVRRYVGMVDRYVGTRYVGR